MRPSRAAQITRQFEQRSCWWDRIYEQTSLEAQILRRRQQVAPSWVDELSLAKGSRVLEIGCGAGATAVELARRGHLVAALDRSPAMLQRTQDHAVTSGVGVLVTPILGDAHRLLFPTGTFDLVLALGALSWLEEPNAAISELARVTRPDGLVLVTSLNSLDLARLLDPQRTPLLGPAKGAARLAAAGLGRHPQDRVRPTRHPSWSLRRQLRRSGLVPIRQATVGFGPFSFLGSPLLSGDHAIRVDQALQQRADHNSNSSAPADGCTSSWPASPTQAKSNLRLVPSSRTSPIAPQATNVSSPRTSTRPATACGPWLAVAGRSQF